jgi:hypothetical protein
VKQRYVFLIAGWSCFVAVFEIKRAVSDYHRPFPAWMNGSRWYEDILSSVFAAMIATACVAYDIRRRRERSTSSIIPSPFWRANIELRVVLYAFAILQFVGVPLMIAHAIIASRDPSPLNSTTFLEAFHVDPLIFAGVGIAVIAYDRYRLRCDLKAEG